MCARTSISGCGILRVSFLQRKNTSQNDFRSMIRHQNPHKNVHYSGVQLFLGHYDFPPAPGSTTKQNLPSVIYIFYIKPALMSFFYLLQGVCVANWIIRTSLGKWALGLGTFRDCNGSPFADMGAWVTGEDTNPLARAK